MKKMIKKSFYIGIALLVLLCACSKKTVPESSQESRPAEQTESAESSEAPSHQLAPEESSETQEEPEQVTEEPLVYLTCLEGRNVVEFCYGGDGSLVAYCANWSGGEYTGEFSDQELVLVDLNTDSVLAAAPMHSEEETLFGMRPNGEVLTRSWITNEILVYDAAMQFDHTEDAFEGQAFYDAGSDSIVYQEDLQILRRDHNGQKSVILDNMLHVSLYDLDPDSGYLVLSAPSEEDTMRSKYVVYDPKAGRIVMDDLIQYGTLTFCGDDILLNAEEFDEETMESTASLRVYSEGTGGETERFASEWDQTIYGSTASPYAVQTTYAFNEQKQVSMSKVNVIDPKHGTRCAKDFIEAEGHVAGARYAEDLGCWILILQNDAEGGETGQIVLARPEKMDLSEELVKLEIPEEKPVEEYPLGEHLLEERAYADQLEETYGVEIILGDELKNVETNSAYELISSEDPDYSPGLEEETQEIHNALTVLDESLAMYPEGFFETFQGGLEEGGVRFILVRDLINTGGSFMPGGLATGSGIWYDIILDADVLIDITVHHEMWHTVEERIIDQGIEGLDEETWKAFDPEGFEYYYDFETYSENLESVYDYTLVSEVDPYFVSIYSITTPQEDRATLVEALFDDSFQYSSDWTGTAKERVYSYPHLKAKLDHMGSLVEEVFGYVYWEEMNI